LEDLAEDCLEAEVKLEASWEELVPPVEPELLPPGESDALPEGSSCLSTQIFEAEAEVDAAAEAEPEPEPEPEPELDAETALARSGATSRGSEAVRKSLLDEATGLSAAAVWAARGGTEAGIGWSFSASSLAEKELSLSASAPLSWLRPCCMEWELDSILRLAADA
jgi:hypothetical protein